jgi:hypothetical protein
VDAETPLPPRPVERWVRAPVTTRTTTNNTTMGVTTRRRRRPRRPDCRWGGRDLRSGDTNQHLTKFSRCAGQQLGLGCVFIGGQYETGRRPKPPPRFTYQHRDFTMCNSISYRFTRPLNAVTSCAPPEVGR